MQTTRLGAFIATLMLLALGLGHGAVRAADCLDTDHVRWTLPDSASGPAWTASTLGADLLGNNKPFAFSVWRRPCGPDNRYAQVLLSFDRQSGLPSIGLFRVRQNNLDLGLTDFVSNKPSVMSDRRTLLAGFFLIGDITGVLEPWGTIGPGFDPRLAFQVVHTPVVHGSPQPGIVINVPAYNAADYGGLNEPYVIGASTTGAWWNTAQPGHGFLIEVQDNGLFSVVWFVYGDDRRQAWIFGGATAVGNSVTIDAMQPVGAQFPPHFNSADVRAEAWGKLRFTFSDCRNGYVEHQKLGTTVWERIELTRLTRPAGSSCR